MKLPALQFYPGDWHKDAGVQALDLRERGAWFEILLMMHDSDERGVLLVNSQPMPDHVLSRRLGLDKDEVNQILTSLINYGVTSRRESDGALICRRMIRDESLRKIRQSAGKQGGNPRLLKQKQTTVVKQNTTPSVSSSFSASASLAPAADGGESPSSPAKPPKPRNPLLDTLAAVDGSDPLGITPSAWPGIGKALADIKTVSPDVTPEEIRKRAIHYRHHHKDATISAHALAKHWAKCARMPGTNPPPAPYSIKQPIPEPMGWRPFVASDMPRCDYAPGQPKQGIAWAQIPIDDQKAITNAMKSHGL